MGVVDEAFSLVVFLLGFGFCFLLCFEEAGFCLSALFWGVCLIACFLFVRLGVIDLFVGLEHRLKQRDFGRMEIREAPFSRNEKIREIPKDFPLLYWFIMKKIREALKELPCALLLW